MTDKQIEIIEAATNTFARYGVKRTTMGDIAEQAGVSRQTLYAFYPGKDEILSAAIVSMANQMLVAVKSDWEGTQDLGERLQIYFNHCILKPYDVLQNMPDLKDVLNGIGDKSACATQNAYELKASLLVDGLSGAHLARNVSEAELVSIANFIENSSRNFKYTVASKKELIELLDTLKRSVIAMIGD